MQSTIETQFSNYSVCISDDPTYYGPVCSDSDAERISENLRNMIEGEFPGITVRTSGAGISGPELNVCDEIGHWISQNWTAAL